MNICSTVFNDECSNNLSLDHMNLLLFSCASSNHWLYQQRPWRHIRRRRHSCRLAAVMDAYKLPFDFSILSPAVAVKNSSAFGCVLTPRRGRCCIVRARSRTRPPHARTCAPRNAACRRHAHARARDRHLKQRPLSVSELLANLGTWHDRRSAAEDRLSLLVSRHGDGE